MLHCTSPRLYRPRIIFTGLPHAVDGRAGQALLPAGRPPLLQELPPPAARRHPAAKLRGTYCDETNWWQLQKHPYTVRLINRALYSLPHLLVTAFLRIYAGRLLRTLAVVAGQHVEAAASMLRSKLIGRQRSASLECMSICLLLRVAFCFLSHSVLILYAFIAINDTFIPCFFRVCPPIFTTRWADRPVGHRTSNHTPSITKTAFDLRTISLSHTSVPIHSISYQV